MSPRRYRLFVLAGLFLGFLPASAPQAVAQSSSVSFSISGNPPPPQPEMRFAPSEPNVVWIPGRWDWWHTWIWIKGHYARPPYPGARWIAGHFVDGYWVPSHWDERHYQPPPPPDPQWQRPHRTAIWIPGHYDWDQWKGRYVWVPGYYEYPPYPGARWVAGHWGEGGRWIPGHWAR